MKSARSTAIDQLIRIASFGADFDADRSMPIRSERDHRLVKEYVQGITRWRRWLDFLIGSYYRGEYESMEEKLKWVLRLGAYDLLFLRTPPHAAIHETVELAKKRVRAGAGGLVNGILRAIDRNRDALPEPVGAPETTYLGIRYSHPDWMVERWAGRYGEEVADLLSWNNERPKYAVRINTLKQSSEAFRELLRGCEITFEEGRYLDDYVWLPRLQPLLHGGFLEKGRCAIQDESSGLIVRLLDPQPGETVIDACAAPGGKTLYIAERMKGQGTLRAFDVQPERLARLDRSLPAYEASWVETSVLDLRASEVNEPADRLLLDVPCTGLGVLAKRADLRWNRRPSDLETITRIQADLLRAASRWVKVGGVLVYSTCSIEPEENEEQVHRFLEEHAGFVVDTADLPPDVLTAEGFVSTLPFKHRMDGMFGVRLKRIH